MKTVFLPAGASARLIALALCAASATASITEVLLDDSFASLANWKDMSLAVDWGTASSPDSAFTVADGVVRITTAASNWTAFNQSTHLRTFTNIDYQFPEAVDHASSVLSIEFRVRFAQVFSTGKGESNRFAVTVQHDYPEGGLDLGDPSLVTNPAGAPWARPAYQVRLRGADDSQLDADNRGSTILQYGGGTVSEGEYEYLHQFGWWVPGFNSSALGNGTHPSGSVSPPGEYSHGGPFPFNSWINTPTGLADTAWQTFRFVIRPDRMELWRDKYENGDWVLEQTMILPKTDEAPAIAYEWGYYNYFERLEGLRLSWRASSIPRDQVYVDSVRVEVERFACPHDYWIRNHFADADIAAATDNRYAPTGDASGDGIANQIARFFGIDPVARHSMHDVVRFFPDAETVTVEYPRSWYAHGLDGGLEWSTDLVEWYREGFSEERVEDTIDPADSGADVTYRDTYYARPEVERGAWTMRATLPHPADAPVFIRVWTAPAP